MSCGSERFCPWKTTTSRSRHAAAIASMSACGKDSDKSTPATSAPNAAFKFLICMAIDTPSSRLAGDRIFLVHGFADSLQLNAARRDRTSPFLYLGCDGLSVIIGGYVISWNKSVTKLHLPLRHERILQRVDHAAV